MIYPKYPEKEKGSIEESLKNGQVYYVKVKMAGNVDVGCLSPNEVARYLHQNKNATDVDDILKVVKFSHKQLSITDLDRLLKQEHKFGREVINKVIDAYGATQIVERAKQAAKKSQGVANELQLKIFRKGGNPKDFKGLTFKNVIAGWASAEQEHASAKENQNNI